MKLYEVPKKRYVKLPSGRILWFDRLDGLSHAYCKVPTTGEVVREGSSTEVEIVEFKPQ